MPDLRKLPEETPSLALQNDNTKEKRQINNRDIFALILTTLLTHASNLNDARRALLTSSGSPVSSSLRIPLATS